MQDYTKATKESLGHSVEDVQQRDPVYAQACREAQTNDDAFFNQRTPQVAVISEKPEHRIMILLKAQGMTNREIAERTGYTSVMVGQVLRQSWARLRLVEELNRAGRDVIADILKSSAVDSIFTLIDLRDNAINESVKKAAASDLLDRFLGKPTQRVETESTVTHLNEKDAIDRQLAELEIEEKRLTGRNN